MRDKYLTHMTICNCMVTKKEKKTVMDKWGHLIALHASLMVIMHACKTYTMQLVYVATVVARIYSPDQLIIYKYMSIQGIGIIEIHTLTHTNMQMHTHYTCTLACTHYLHTCTLALCTYTHTLSREYKISCI